MTDSATIKLIEDKIQRVEAEGFGEVIVKIKNGWIYRILVTTDMLIENPVLDNKSKS